MEKFQQYGITVSFDIPNKDIYKDIEAGLKLINDSIKGKIPDGEIFVYAVSCKENILACYATSSEVEFAIIEKGVVTQNCSMLQFENITLEDYETLAYRFENIINRFNKTGKNESLQNLKKAFIEYKGIKAQKISQPVKKRPKRL
ncbi:MAG: hypothetical protein E7242_01075 [Lachnospiraceae bacterium]|nr:hypothetical protein [Lachnospiraceae bacterium]